MNLSINLSDVVHLSSHQRFQGLNVRKLGAVSCKRFSRQARTVTNLGEDSAKVMESGMSRSKAKDVVLSRRSMMLVSTSVGMTAPLLLSPASLAEDLSQDVQTFDKISGERFTPVAANFQLPESWRTRPGQKPKPGKFLLYTDTYGPNYRYFSQWPKFRDEVGSCVDSIEVAVSGISGLTSITDLGPQKNLEPQRAFGLSREDLTDGPPVDVVSSGSRTDANGQVYYEWELLTAEGATVLVSAAASGGGLYAMGIGALPEQWKRGGESMRKIQASFTISPTEESRDDLSSRIYGQKKEGGFN